MATTKKVFFGSLFQFTSTGAEEILAKFRDQFIDPEEVPFVSYDTRTRLFSCEIDSSDDTMVSLINAQIDAYITVHGQKPREPLDSDLLLPINGTLIRDDIFGAGTRDLEPNLLFDLDDTSEDDDQDLAIEASNTTYWVPKCGDISILSRDVAAEIADATGCFFIPDLAAQKIRLAQGNLQLALSKLQNLEDVLMQSNGSNVHSTWSSIPLSHSSHGLTVKFVHPVHPSCSFDRIILEPTQISESKHLLVAEARIWQDTQRIKPTNLDLEDVSITARNGPSKSLEIPTITTFGLPKNKDPRPPSNENSQTAGEIQRPGSPTKFLGQKEAERVEEWREKIDPEAAPTLPPAEPVPEQEKTSGRRRMVSDSEGSSDEDLKNKCKPSRKMTTPSEEPISRQGQTSGRRRKVLDSEGSSDEGCKNKPKLLAKPTSKFTSISGEDGRSERPLEDKNLHDELKIAKPTFHSPKSATYRAGETFVPVTEHPGFSRTISSRSRSKSTNMFEPIEVEGRDDQQESESEIVVPEKLSPQVKQLNVTFEEPEHAMGSGTHHFGTTSSPKSNDPATAAPSPSKQGERKHMSQSRFGQSQGQAQQSYGQSKITTPNSVQPRSKPFESLGPAMSPSKSFETRKISDACDKNFQSSNQYRKSNLIDVSAEEIPDQATMPPPGFELRSKPLAQDRKTAVAALSARKNSPTMSSMQKHDNSSYSSPAATSSVDRHAGRLDFVPQLAVPKRNVSYMKNQAVARLQAQMREIDEKNTETSDEQKILSPNRVKKDDEVNTRRYHKTMTQRMAKPAKGKKAQHKTETKAEREARIAKVKAEAYHDTVPAKISTNRLQPSPATEGSSGHMTARKRQILKTNLAMAEMHQDVIADNADQEAAGRLVEDLRPLLQTTRAFKGEVRVEVQFGQALVLKNNRVDESRLYTLREWTQLLNSKTRNTPHVTFTNVLTTNGQDIDRMLELKNDTKSSKMWNKAHPGPTTINFEFSCQDKSGQDFIIVLDQDGNHSLKAFPVIIGRIALHALSQIWDACATVHGSMNLLRPSEEVIQGAEQFKQNLYIPGGTKAVVYYRLPANNAFTVRAITMKRTSIHDSLIPGRESIQLRITEVKALAHSSNPTDKKLFRSYESNFDVMQREGRLHYEVAVLDKNIEALFKANPDIELGELAPIDTPDGAMISYRQAYDLIQVTTSMLERIDWAGAHNIGTLRRMAENAADHRASIINTLAPTHNRNLAIPIGTTAPPTVAPSAYTSQQYSRVGAGTNANINVPEPILRPLQGVRAHTAAELYQDHSTGEFFYFGQGGSRIPIVNDQFEGPRFDGFGPVQPADSASQIGAARNNGPGGAHMPTTPKSRAGNWDDKPAGFW